MKTFDFMEPMLRQAVLDGCFPSAAAAIGVGGRPLGVCAVGNADVRTRFDVASMTKILSTTMLALLAIENGQITLWDTLSRFFDAPDDKKDITIFQLMTHTGKFTPSFDLRAEAEGPDDVAACILRRPLEDVAGGAPSYSCMGYILLGKILEHVYGDTLDVLAKNLVFAPLGMQRTGYLPEGGNIAPTEINAETGKAWRGIVHDENARYMGGVSGNAGVFSDIGDCARFAAMLASGGEGLLSPAMLRKAIRNYTPGHDVHRGLGFHLAGTPYSFMGDLFPDDAFGHTGFTGTSLAVDPATGFYAVLLSNRVHPSRENDKHLRFRRVFHNRVYAAFSRMAGED